jgi:hypothetical protein
MAATMRGAMETLETPETVMIAMLTQRTPTI